MLFYKNQATFPSFAVKCNHSNIAGNQTLVLYELLIHLPHKKKWGFGSDVSNGSVDIRRKLQYSQLFAHVILLFTVSEG